MLLKGLEDTMKAWDRVDDWEPAWPSFARLFYEEPPGESDAEYLVELDREHGTRREWTRSQWRSHVARTAAGLSGHGVTRGDSVALLAGNSADALAVAFACWAHGWVYVPLNGHESIDRLAFIVSHTRARVLAHSAAESERAGQLSRREGIPAVLTTEVAAADAGTAPTYSRWDVPALRVYTSGTTGEPKGVQLTTRNLIVDCDALSRVTAWDAGTRVLVVLPIHHVNGLVVSCLQAWYTGASVVLCDRFRSETFWSDADQHAVTASSLVPTLLEFLLRSNGQPPETFREVYCGAGPLMSTTVLSFESRFGIPVRHLYGLSETTAVATMMPALDDDERRAWYTDYGFPSIGPAVSHVEVQVHDESGRECAEDVRGEIVIRGATVMSGYSGRPEETARAMHRGWFHSGDEGFWRRAADGTRYFFITGRMKELIIRGGVNISPLQIDAVLTSHPGVEFALAIPFENRFYGEEIAAYVVTSGEVSEEALLEFCAERLDFAYRPKLIIFGEDVPFTSTGKARRLSLKARLAAELAPYREVQFRRSRDDSVPH